MSRLGGVRRELVPGSFTMRRQFPWEHEEDRGGGGEDEGQSSKYGSWFSVGAASRASSPAIGATKGPREELGLLGSYLAGIHPAFRVPCA